MKEKFAIASIRAIKSSPLKAMKVTKSISGRNVSEALKLLSFSKLGLAYKIRSIIYSAVANAENNHNMNIDNLYIKEIDVGRAFALKRFSARGRGKSSVISKTYSRVKVKLAERA